MGLINNNQAVAAGKQPFNTLNHFLERRHVPIHAVNPLDSNKDAFPPLAYQTAFLAIGQPGQDLAQALWPLLLSVCGVHRVVRKSNLLLRSAQLHAIVDTGVDELVIDDDVARLRGTAEEPDVSVKARVEEQAGRAAVEGCDISLEGFCEGHVAV